MLNRTAIFAAALAPALGLAAGASAGVVLGIDLNNFAVQGPADLNPWSDTGVLHITPVAETHVASIQIDSVGQPITDTDGLNDGQPPATLTGQFTFNSGAITAGSLSFTDEDGDALNITNLTGNIMETGMTPQNIILSTQSFAGVFDINPQSDGLFFGVNIDDWLNAQPLDAGVFAFGYNSAGAGYDRDVDAEIELTVGDGANFIPAPGTLPAGMALIGLIGLFTRRTAGAGAKRQ